MWEMCGLRDICFNVFNVCNVEVAVLGVLLVLTVLGNAVVLLALYARRRCGGRRKLSRMFYFILHLSVADMVTAFFSVLPQLVWKVTFRFHGGNFLCKAVKFGQPLGVYLSSYVLTATACDRYRAICHPLTYCSWTSRRAKTMVWAAWGVAICFSAPQAFIFSYRQVGPGETDCWADFPPDWGVRSYVTWYACSVFVVPLVVLFFTYSRITCEIWRSRTNPLISRAKINTVKQSVLVIMLYIVCSGPFICAQLWAAWTTPGDGASNAVREDAEYLQDSSNVYTILTLLFSLNSCVNPWIYLAFNKELRSPLFLLLSCRACKQAAIGRGQSAAAGSMHSSCSSVNNGHVAAPATAAPGASCVTIRDACIPA
ncbi:Vasopressin Receptor 1 [Frankliniella occidentalis]|nr:Vasopressin Receptor 1 [Frankliniella occidentalis]